MALLTIALWVVGRSVGGLRAIDITAALGFWYNQLRVSERFYGGPMTNVWSVCVEVHSYILIAIVAWLAKRSVGSGLIILALVSIGMAMLGIALFELIPNATYYDVYWRSDVRVGSALMGAIGFLITARYSVTGNSIYALGFLVAALLLSSDLTPEPVKYTAGTFALAAAVTILGRKAINPDAVRTVLRFRLLTFFGTISYSLYLWQFPLLLLKRLPGGTFIGLGLALVISCASYYWLEKPARDWINKRYRLHALAV
jgi:peptidoglycan/LPS O-acetylase OafA/YrhL